MIIKHQSLNLDMFANMICDNKLINHEKTSFSTSPYFFS